MSHPLDHPNADIGCRWLCETAGQRSQRDEDYLTRSCRDLPFGAQPLPLHLFPPFDLGAVK